MSIYEFRDKRSLNTIDLNEIASIHNNDAGFFKFGDIYRGSKLTLVYKSSNSACTFVFKNKELQDLEYRKIKSMLLQKGEKHV